MLSVIQVAQPPRRVFFFSFLLFLSKIFFFKLNLEATIKPTTKTQTGGVSPPGN